ncbi:Stp1/IreP family PP2C-type Ser/Thr phosphatase [Anaerotignum sp. MB30-C6]|uniref:Stp1/IreP family PP2C-type Ser/Thr phosphatase n=1 Tax=Anaerotignum sp. MB30-C6 TaxID=3070814 RepID=UPI0027DDE6D0|nr:Stp1/IreP family PP2C-type Ser/Thr phosphatase [Anaerotignum sp. MB30-C6]WMI80425.1 Stp1/IreP family PP2C-type Ser/Thr phosphatase [Anaerotignum sp. MB30-C6]
MKAVGISDIGKCRKNNEDAFYVPSCTDDIQNLFIVADGMGGCNAGEVASRYAIDSFLYYIRQERDTHCQEDIPDLLTEAMVASNKAVYEKSNSGREFAEMGTTLVAAAVQDGKIFVAYVGDSRAYLFRKKELNPLTTDHSYVMELVKVGSITREEAATHPKRNIITRAVGIKETVETDAIVENAMKGDILLLCTDGLSGMLSDKDMAEIIGKRMTLEKKAQRLVEMANERGGYDNISLILVDVGGKN